MSEHVKALEEQFVAATAKTIRVVALLAASLADHLQPRNAQIPDSLPGAVSVFVSPAFGSWVMPTIAIGSVGR